jgi:BlaI family penicillinase repressor
MTFSPLEEQIMNIVWKLGKAFPKEIIAYMDQPVPPYNTVLSTIRKLEKDGLIGFHTFGKSHQYFPKIEKENFSKSAFSRLYRKYLDANKSSLLSYFMQEENISVEELEELVKKLKS